MSAERDAREAARTEDRRAFVRAAGFDPDRMEALPADASPRRYFRLHGGSAPRLLMDAAPAPDFRAFLKVARHLTGRGFSAPGIDSADPERGFAVIEDFGDRTYTRLLAEGADERVLYELAVDTLAALHDSDGSARIDVPPYDDEPLFLELQMFTDWFTPQVAPGIDVAAFRTAFFGLWDAALAEVKRSRDALVLRDFHVDNLMIVDGRSGVAACGLLDFQDALIGSSAYDLVSLTQDARRDLMPGLEDALVERYLAARPGLDRTAFLREYHLLAAHRHTKIAGNFERLSKRDGKHGYLVHIPRVLRLLDKEMDAAGLTEIRAFLDRTLPGWAEWRPTPPAA